jgi:YHS domain-containing protein
MNAMRPNLVMNHFFAALFAMLLSCGSFAQTSINTVGSDDKTAISGFDPVSFLLQNKAMKGDPSISYEYFGAKWIFSSPENRDAFRGNPDKFIPVWGGQCAWAVSEKTLSTKKLSGSFDVISSTYTKSRFE